MRAPLRGLLLGLALAAAPLAAAGQAVADDDAWVERMGRVGRAYAPSFSPDGRTVYLGSNAGRDRLAFARIRLPAAADPGFAPAIEILAAAELGGWRKVTNRVRSTVETVRFFDQHLGDGRE